MSGRGAADLASSAPEMCGRRLALLVTGIALSALRLRRRVSTSSGGRDSNGIDEGR
jgi:hypothetical protein